MRPEVLRQKKEQGRLKQMSVSGSEITPENAVCADGRSNRQT